MESLRTITQRTASSNTEANLQQHLDVNRTLTDTELRALTREQRKERATLQGIHLIWLMRKSGASIRDIAKGFGMSKSQVGRLVQVLDPLTEAELSQLGQPDQKSAEVSEAENCELSQLGQEAAA